MERFARRRGACVARTLLVVPIAMVALFTASAEAASATSVVMLSDPGDWVGSGDHRLFHPGNGSVTVSGSTSHMSVRASGGTGGDSFSLDFAAPPGQSLAPGVYERAQRASFREAGRPGIDVYGDGRGCNTIAGRFEVKELVTDQTGAIVRAWILYEQHCEEGVPALFGEVRIGVSIPAGSSDPAPSALRWPGVDLGRSGTVVPITIVVTNATRLTSTSVLGPNAGDFPIRLDECSGRTVPAAGSCQVWLRFTPSAAGARTATLRIADGAGAHDDVPLSGLAYGGSTRVIMDSEAGDYIGQGRQWSYAPANAAIHARGTRRHVSFSVNGSDGSWWTADFAAPQGDILAPGSYPNATRYPFQGTGAGLDVSGNGRGCNVLDGEFTVTDASFEPDGGVRSFGATFEQHCEGAEPDLRGVFEFRAATQAPWPPGPGPDPGPTPGPDPNPGPGPDPGPTPNPAPDPGSDPPPTARLPLRAGRPAPLVFAPRGTGQAALPSGPCKRPRFSGAKVLRGTARADRIRGGPSGEVVLAGSGNDHVRTGAGTDCIDGGRGRDILSGGSGADRLAGGSGNDLLVGGIGRDTLNCGRGRDVARASQGDRVRGCEHVVRTSSR